MKKAITKTLTRREMLRGIFSKDTLKDIYGAWHGFNEEIEQSNKLTGDAAVLDMTRRLKLEKKSKIKLLSRKEGKS
jgi:hypothetical protein